MKTLCGFVNTKAIRRDGTYDSYLTISVPIKETEYIPRKGQTVTCYGRAMPTPYMVFFNNRWQRVKNICFSNSGSLYIGKSFDPQLTVSIDWEDAS